MTILFVLICIAAPAIYKLLPVFSGGHQTFTDIIIENVSASGYDKSGELELFWLVLAAGSLIILAALAFRTYLSKTDNARIQLSDYRFPLYGGMLFFPFLVYLIVFGQFSIPLFAGLIIFILCYYLCPGCRSLTGQILLTYVLTYYAFLSLFTTIMKFLKTESPSSSLIYILTFTAGTVFSVLTILLSRRNQDSAFGRRLLLLLQCTLPGLLLLWLIDDYLYREELIHLPYATGYTVFFILFMGIAFALVIRQAVKFWNKNEKYVIGAITPILIFVYHSFSAAPMFAQPDQHHHGEQMIPWNQVFVHGQSLYDEYTPVSGLFPYVNGFIQHILLDGTITDYAPAISITTVIFCTITMYLIYKHVGGSYATAFAVLFALPSYNRQYMVLPVLLLLTLPVLLKKQNLWLQVWIIACFLSGLYYPLYGVGLLIGTLPLGIYQLITYVKKGTFQKDIHKLSFYITWVILLLVVTWNIPLLIRMLNHTLTYSSQTIMADGIPLLGQTAPDSFLPFLSSHEALRNACYLSYRFLLPAIGIWLFVYVAFHMFFSHKGKRDRKLTLFLISGAVTLMISYTYTLVRADTDKILSRTAMILIAVAGMFLPVMLMHYGRLQFKSTSLAAIIGICASLPMAIYMQVSWYKFPDMWVYPDGNSQLVMDDADKLYSYMEVPETFLKSEDTGLAEKYQELLGRGFMVADQLHYITDYASVIEKCEAVCDDVAYMAFDGQGFYDYLGVKCSATGYIPAARSYEAQKEIWDAASQNLPVVFYLQPQSSYYIFRFMLDEGYVYCAADNAFYPPKLYALIYADSGNIDGDDYRLSAPAVDFERSAESFGASLHTLQDLFVTDCTVSLSGQNLPQSFSGMEYDFLYLELAEDLCSPDASEALPEDSVLKISWADTDGNTFENSSVSCTLTDGRLLIPMGMNACWLLSEIDDFTISVLSSDSSEVLLETTYKRLISSEEDSAFVKNLSLMQLDIKR